MSTPPLLNLPASACFANIVMTLTRTVGATVSPFTLEEQFFKWPGSAWSAEVSLPPITSRAIAADWISFGLNLEGSYGHFLMGDPMGKTPRGVATGTPIVSGANQNGNTLITTGWTPSTTGILLKGDYIQIGTGSSSRLHMVTQDVNSDGSGLANLNIQPALRTPPPNLSTVYTHNTVGLFRMVDNNFSWGVSPGVIYRISFRAQEVVLA